MKIFVIVGYFFIITLLIGILLSITKDNVENQNMKTDLCFQNVSGATTTLFSYEDLDNKKLWKVVDCKLLEPLNRK